MKNATIKALQGYPEGAVKTITTDNGSEFARWQEIEDELKTNVYFADPYCAWQKGTNENLNGLLREFYPKGRNLARVSAKTLAQNCMFVKHLLHIGEKRREELIGGLPAQGAHREVVVLVHVSP